MSGKPTGRKDQLHHLNMLLWVSSVVAHNKNVWIEN